MGVSACVELSAQCLILVLRVAGRTEPIPIVVKEELMGFGRLQMEVNIKEIKVPSNGVLIHGDEEDK